MRAHEESHSPPLQRNDDEDMSKHMASFERAVQAHSRTLWSVAANVLGRREGAEDVVQEAVVVALGKRHEFPRVENFVAWMAQIVRYVALNRRRFNRIRIAEGDDRLSQVAGDEVGGPPPDQLLSMQGALKHGEALFDDQVLRAVNALDETPRACLLLRVLNDLSYKEIGQVLEIPEGTAMSHVFRARKLLMQRLGERSPGPERMA
ncbi:MAG TPA: RNA polymerase sigma factor [Tepidisphaeraceae bacterium]|nr:RNA polymerase sigma factor [Tepidisphaeraceae bacterium]